MERIRFLHIPKTAGRSFEGILRRQYFGHRFYYGDKVFRFTGNFDSDIKRYEALSENDKNKVVLYYCHMPINTGIKEMDDATIITFLRNPVERVKAFCQHVREGKSPHLRNVFPPDSFDLDKLLDSGYPELYNLQTKMLINSRTNASNLLIDSMSPSEAIDMALDNLDNKISYFGLTEYFDESIIYISSALNWRMPLYTPLNIEDSRKLIEFEKHHIERITEFNSIDIELYKRAKEKFLNILDSEAFDKAKLKRFQRINKLLYTNFVNIKKPVVELKRFFTG